jgi:hypothetical protein
MEISRSRIFYIWKEARVILLADKLIAQSLRRVFMVVVTINKKIKKERIICYNQMFLIRFFLPY